MMRCREQGFDTLAASLGLLSLFGVMPENDASRPAVRLCVRDRAVESRRGRMLYLGC